MGALVLGDFSCLVLIVSVKIKGIVVVWSGGHKIVMSLCWTGNGTRNGWVSSRES